MEQDLRKYTKYNEPVLKCACGCEFFEKITANRFRTSQTDLSNGQRPMNKDHSVTVQKCLQCDTMQLPSLWYQNSPIEKELTLDLIKVLDNRKEIKNAASIPNQRETEKVKTRDSD